MLKTKASHLFKKSCYCCLIHATPYFYPLNFEANMCHFHKRVFHVLFFLSCFLICSTSCHRSAYRTAVVKNDSIKIGAYYFDGWTGKTFHVSPKLRDSFPERKPVWGWVTSTPEVVHEQINLAADAGLSFFNFCWYYAKGE